MAFSHSPKIVTDGLVLYLDAANTKSYPGSGTTWYDLSGNGYNGTLNNGPVFSLNKITTDGIDDHILIPDSGPLAVTPTDSFTVEVVFAINSLEFRVDGLDSACSILGRGSTAGSHGIGCNQDFDTGQLSAYMGSRGVNQITTQLNIDNDVVYHGTFSYTPVIQRGYLNGEQFGTADTTSGAGGTFDQDDWAILENRAVPGGNGQHVSGSVFLARIYNRVLTATEIQQNYNATKGRFGL